MWHTTFLDRLKVKYQSRKVDQKTPILDLYHRGTQKTVQFWTCIFTMSNSNVWTVICPINLSIWLRYEKLTVKFYKFSVRAQWRLYQLYSATEERIALSSSETMKSENLKKETLGVGQRVLPIIPGKLNKCSRRPHLAGASQVAITHVQEMG